MTQVFFVLQRGSFFIYESLTGNVQDVSDVLTARRYPTEKEACRGKNTLRVTECFVVKVSVTIQFETP